MQTSEYDLAIIGFGIAGSSLAYHLAQYSDNNIKIVIFDPKENHNEKHIDFWSKETTWEEVSHKSWDILTTKTPNQTIHHNLKSHRFYSLNPILYYEHILRKLPSSYEFVNKAVIDVMPNNDRIEIRTNNHQTYTVRHVFDSRLQHSPQSKIYQFFESIDFSIGTNTLNPQRVTFMDFSHDNNVFSFRYLLPWNTHNGRIFEVVITKNKPQQFQTIDYLHQTLGTKQITITNQQSEAVPLQVPRSTRNIQPHWTTIGAGAGLIKASSGFGFMRIWNDSQHIAECIIHNKPMTSLYPRHYSNQIADQGFIHVLAQHPRFARKFFASMFNHYSLDTIFEFLDEDLPLKHLLLKWQ